MKNRICPICQRNMNEHDQKQTDKCLKRFMREATNPVVYASVNKLFCPICEKEMLDHTSKQAIECVNEFIKDVTDEEEEEED